MKENLNKPICIGILGGGQLARMSAFQAIRMGFDVAILDKQKNSPAGMLTKKEYIGWVDDHDLLNNISLDSDVITLENEFIESKHLEYIEFLGKEVIPSSKTISLIQDKLIQKSTLSKAELPVPAFLEISNQSYSNVSEILGKKFVLKSRTLGYDGYGNRLIENEIDYKKGLIELAKRDNNLLAEEFVEFTSELAIMVVRSKSEIKTYPVVETIQRNHICHLVIAPAEINPKLEKEIKNIAIEAVRAVDGYGIYGIEFFLTKDNKVLINEMAPRPHNSGHYTIEGCVTSQFENHIRSVLNLPLGNTDMVKPIAVMVNTLGKKNDLGIVENYEDVLKDEEAHLHIYGKSESRIGRKMGHITLIGEDREALITKAKHLEEKIKI